MDLNDSLLEFAATCSVNTAGDMINGIVHNLNNPLHALTMQTELFQNALSKEDLESMRLNLQEKCIRLQRIGQELKAQLDILSWRDAYVSPKHELIDPVHYGTWFLQFWKSNLFFKHNVSATMSTDPPPPHIQAIPLAITWSLEEPLRTFLGICQKENVQGVYQMHLNIGALSKGIAIRMEVLPEPDAAQTIALSLQHASQVRDLTTALGWEWRACLVNGALSVELNIP